MALVAPEGYYISNFMRKATLWAAQFPVKSEICIFCHNITYCDSSKNIPVRNNSLGQEVKLPTVFAKPLHIILIKHRLLQ